MGQRRNKTLLSFLMVVAFCGTCVSGLSESDFLDSMRTMQLPSIDAQDFYASHSHAHTRFRSPRSIKFEDDHSATPKKAEAVSASFGLGPSGLTGSVSAAQSDGDKKGFFGGYPGVAGGHGYYPPPGFHHGHGYPGHYPHGGLGAVGGSSSSAAAASSSSGAEVGVQYPVIGGPIAHGGVGGPGVSGGVYPLGGVGAGGFGGYPGQYGGAGYYPGGGNGYYGQYPGYGYPGGYFGQNYGAHPSGVYGGVGGPGFGGPGFGYGPGYGFGGFRKGEDDSKNNVDSNKDNLFKNQPSGNFNQNAEALGVGKGNGNSKGSVLFKEN